MKGFFGWAGGQASRWPARVPIAGAVVLAAAVVVLLGAPAASAASTLYVNAATGTDSLSCGASASPCQTIQQAVDNAGDGDTIQVAAGAYPAQAGGSYDRLLIDKSVKLEGAQAGNAGSAARLASPAGESVIDEHVDITASGVTLDGFSSDYPGTQLFINGPSGTTIENDVFSGYEPDNYTAYYITSAIGVHAAPGTAIKSNYFTSPGSTDGAVQFFNGGCTDTVVSGNTFYAAANDGLGTIFFYCEDQPSADISVSGNDDVHVGDTNGESFLVAEAVAGDIHVTGNTVTADYPSSGFYFTLSPNLGAVDITGNSVVGSGSSAITIRPTGGGSGSYTITGNQLSGGKYGLYVYSGALANGATVTLHGNDLSGNSRYGVYDDASSGGSVDAADNWWGCNAGPAVAGSGCSGFVGGVTYDPWLVLGVSAAPSSLPVGSNSTVTADLTHDSAGNDASASGMVPDGTSIAFATDFGTLSASSAGTTAGNASATLTSSSEGTANVSATLDSQMVSTAVTFTPPPRPTSADQCNKGGWQSYGVFKNQGDCVSFVATHGKNPPGK